MKCDFLLSLSDLQVGVVFDLSLGVVGSVYIDNRSGSWEYFDWKFLSSCIIDVDEVFHCSAVQESLCFGPFTLRMYEHLQIH